MFEELSHNITFMGTHDVLLVKWNYVTRHVWEDDINVNIHEVISMTGVNYELSLTLRVYVALNFVYSKADENKGT